MEVCTLSEAKEHLRLTYDDDDGYIANLIRGATDYIAGVTGYPIQHQSRALYWSNTRGQYQFILDSGYVVEDTPVVTLYVTGEDYLKNTDGEIIPPDQYALTCFEGSYWDRVNCEIVEGEGYSWAESLSEQGIVKIRYDVEIDRIKSEWKLAAFALIKEMYEKRGMQSISERNVASIMLDVTRDWAGVRR